MINKTGFETAKENMDYDVDLFEQLKESNQRFFRIYEWKHVGLTQSEKRDIPKDLLAYDHSYRLTGGGVVFHCPGDIVFSIGGSLGDDYFPSKSKDLMLWCSQLFSSALQSMDIPVYTKDELNGAKNINFCASYFNPYELYVKDAKVFGFALKKTRSHFLIQGVVHVLPTEQGYSSVANLYSLFFTKGIQQSFNIDRLYKQLESLIST